VITGAKQLAQTQYFTIYLLGLDWKKFHLKIKFFVKRRLLIAETQEKFIFSCVMVLILPKGGKKLPTQFIAF